jgi:hypothetical protein
MMHPTIPSLFFIGLFQPLGCIWRLADHQSRIAALQLAGRLNRPPDIEARINHELARACNRTDPSPRHAIAVDYHAFRRKLLHELRRESPSAPWLRGDHVVLPYASL